MSVNILKFEQIHSSIQLTVRMAYSSDPDHTADIEPLWFLFSCVGVWVCLDLFFSSNKSI